MAHGFVCSTYKMVPFAVQFFGRVGEEDEAFLD